VVRGKGIRVDTRAVLLLAGERESPKGKSSSEVRTRLRRLDSVRMTSQLLVLSPSSSGSAESIWQFPQKGMAITAGHISEENSRKRLMSVPDFTFTLALAQDVSLPLGYTSLASTSDACPCLILHLPPRH
jgi:hypothetical protein